MNRVIKFRAWDRKRKRMYEVLHLHMKGDFNNNDWATVKGYDIIEQKDIHLQIQPKDCVLMQFTGLLDKNGKEIYEGDIIAVKFHPHYVERVSWVGEPDATAEVFWDLNAFRLKAKGQEDNRYADFFDFVSSEVYGYKMCDISYENTEIIGNIYENPQLINK